MEKETTMAEFYKEQIERMEKQGYTTEEIVMEINRMINLQNQVAYATL